MQERTEKPTARALRKARERGEVAQSRELTSAVGLAVALVGLTVSAPGILRALGRSAHACWTAGSRANLEVSVALQIVLHSAVELLAALAPLLIALVIVSVIVPLLQVQPMFTLQPMVPKLDRLDLVKGIKRIFGSLRTYVELLKSMVKMAIVGLVCGLFVYAELREIVRAGFLPLGESALLLARLLTRVAGTVIAIYFALAVFDFAYQRWQYTRDHRMTKEEVRREQYDMFGKPEHRAARTRLRRELAQASMLEESREANGMIANPTHLICAVRFDPRRERAPRVIGKGSGPLAARLRAIAEEEDIPIIHNISLARALFELDINTTVPPALYDAVRIVLQWVEEVMLSKGRTPPWREHEAVDEDAAPTG